MGTVLVYFFLENRDSLDYVCFFYSTFVIALHRPHLSLFCKEKSYVPSDSPPSKISLKTYNKSVIFLTNCCF